MKNEGKCGKIGDMKSKICYVYGAGEHFSPPPLPLPGDFVIAADGGYDFLKGHGITPDLAVGDFDSCQAPPVNVKTILLPCEKDCTDTAEALRIGFERDFRIFHIYGGTGGRIEHTFANVQCLADLAAKGAQGFLFDRDNVITAIKNRKIAFDANAAGYVSVFAHSDTASGICEKGLKYPLDDAVLHNTNPLGISNEFIGEASSISVGAGTIIVVYPINCNISL